MIIIPGRKENSLPFRKKSLIVRNTGLEYSFAYFITKGRYEARVTTRSVDDFTMDVSSVG